MRGKVTSPIVINPLRVLGFKEANNHFWWLSHTALMAKSIRHAVGTRCGTLLFLSTDDAYEASQENTVNKLVYYKKTADQMEDKINPHFRELCQRCMK